MAKARGLIGEEDTSLIESVAYVIERERLKTGVTRTQQAADLGLSVATYFHIRKHAANLTLLQTAEIARRLGVSNHELLFGKQFENR